MDLPNFQIARPEFKDFRRPILTQHVHIEVVLVDSSQQGVLHHVFQLNSSYVSDVDQIDRLKQELSHLHGDAFTFLGEANEIDTVKKIIVLGDGNMITYKYMIVVSSPCHIGEFHAFLPALKDTLLMAALNAKAKINETERHPKPFQEQNFSAKEADASSSKVSPLIKKKMEGETQTGNALNVPPKKVCQVKT